VWWKRCQIAAEETGGAGLFMLRYAAAVPACAGVACLGLHATLGFAGAGSPSAAAAQAFFSVLTRAAVAGVLAGVTAVEWKAGLASVPVSAARACLAIVTVGCFVAAAGAWGAGGCPASHLTFPELAAPPCGDGACCASLIASKGCRSVAVSPACEAAAGLELAAVLAAVAHLASLAVSLRTARCALVVLDRRLRDGGGGLPLELAESGAWSVHREWEVRSPSQGTGISQPLSPPDSQNTTGASGWGTPAALLGARPRWGEGEDKEGDGDKAGVLAPETMLARLGELEALKLVRPDVLAAVQGDGPPPPLVLSGHAASLTPY